eukprot:gene8545-8728_t
MTVYPEQDSLQPVQVPGWLAPIPGLPTTLCNHPEYPSLASPHATFSNPAGLPKVANSSGFLAGQGGRHTCHEEGAVRAVAAAPRPPPIAKPRLTSNPSRERRRGAIRGLEAELSDKLAQLQMLTAENELLKLRRSVLEATVEGEAFQEHQGSSAAASAGTVKVVMRSPSRSSSLSAAEGGPPCAATLQAVTAAAFGFEAVQPAAQEDFLLEPAFVNSAPAPVVSELENSCEGCSYRNVGMSVKPGVLAAKTSSVTVSSSIMPEL